MWKIKKGEWGKKEWVSWPRKISKKLWCGILLSFTIFTLYAVKWNHIVVVFFFLKKISDKHDDVQQESIHAELFSHKFNLKYKTGKKIKERLKK